jgi:hypothetical protein
MAVAIIFNFSLSIFNYNKNNIKNKDTREFRELKILNWIKHYC